MLSAANVQAEAVAMRTIDGAVRSLITMGAQRISFAGFEFQSKEPRDFTAWLGSNGVWEIMAIDDCDEPVVLTDGMRAGQ